MLKVGVTGGIGSGKSVVCDVFHALGIPVYKADDAARYLMEHDEAVVSGVRAIFGDVAYAGGKLNREGVSSIVYSSPEKLQRLNELVHPATIAYGKRWMEQQTTRYVIKDAAIFFESGSNKDMDVMIGVYAPEEIRIRRTMLRSGFSEEKVRSIMAQQMNEEDKMRLCNYVITNDYVTAVLPQVLSLHNKLLGY